MDIAHEWQLLDLLRDERPFVVHFAEQRAAYSMKSSAAKRHVDNGINAHNLLAAIVESGQDIHVVHLGTMGVYGYGSTAAPPSRRLPQGGSCHQPTAAASKEISTRQPGQRLSLAEGARQLLFLYYNKNDKVRITDLHQGIVWGTNTDATDRHRDRNHFGHGGDYGTVLNRFLMQAIGYAHRSWKG